jgi:hypothetical protein
VGLWQQNYFLIGRWCHHHRWCHHQRTKLEAVSFWLLLVFEPPWSCELYFFCMASISNHFKQWFKMKNVTHRAVCPFYAAIGLLLTLVLTVRFLPVFFLDCTWSVSLYIFKVLPMNQRITLGCFSIRNMSLIFFFTFFMQFAKTCFAKTNYYFYERETFLEWASMCEREKKRIVKRPVTFSSISFSIF